MRKLVAPRVVLTTSRQISPPPSSASTSRTKDIRGRGTAPAGPATLAAAGWGCVAPASPVPDPARLDPARLDPTRIEPRPSPPTLTEPTLTEPTLSDPRLT